MGCFWHGCAEHGHVPQRNRQYWGNKIKRNIERDRHNDALLVQAGMDGRPRVGA